jgi:uncharacterized protein YfiM (DUF2279 family)
VFTSVNLRRRFKVKKILMMAALVAASFSAQADEWHGRDKQLHAIGGAIVAGSVHQLTDSRWAGFAASLAVGIGKELVDMRMPGHTPSLKDAVVTAMGGSLVLVPGLSIGPGWISYRKEF